MTKKVSDITPFNLHNFEKNSDIFGSGTLHTCDDVVSLKRKKLHLEDIEYNLYSHIDKDNNSKITGEDDTFGINPQSKRRKL